MQSSVLEDECELDLLGLDRYDINLLSRRSDFKSFYVNLIYHRDMDSNGSSYLVVQTPGDRHLLNQLNGGT